MTRLTGSSSSLNWTSRIGMWGTSFMAHSMAGNGEFFHSPCWRSGLFPISTSIILPSGAYMLASIPLASVPECLAPRDAKSPEWSKWLLHLPITDMDKVIGHPLFGTRHDGDHPAGWFWRRADASEIEHINSPAAHRWLLRFSARRSEFSSHARAVGDSFRDAANSRSYGSLGP